MALLATDLVPEPDLQRPGFGPLRFTGCPRSASPATGRPVDFRGMTWLTFKDRVIVEGWGSRILGRLLESLK